MKSSSMSRTPRFSDEHNRVLEHCREQIAHTWLKQSVCSRKVLGVLKIGAVVFIFIIITRILGYLFRIIIARHDFNLYGQYNLALIIINIIIPIILLGFTFGIIRYVSFYNARGEKEKSNEDLMLHCSKCFSANVGMVSGCAEPTCFDCGYSKCS